MGRLRATNAAGEGRLGGFNDERAAIISQVVSRVLERYLDRAAHSREDSLEYVLNEVAFSEIHRVEHSSSRSARKQLSRWRGLAGRIGRMSELDKRAELDALTRHYATDVAGNFNPRVYRFARDILPPALSLLLSPISSVRDGLKALGSLSGQVQVTGEVERVRTCCERGTLVLAPTHSSNLDSIVLGLGLTRVGLPPVVYGAGKNLFSNPLISYFMHNLGAYRVDRRLKFTLYKDVLKEYSTVLLERGYHSLFFPGGTRSRSNCIEQHLKLGLLGTVVTAYQNTLREGGDARPIYVVPVTINYRLVLEAETLIEDYLAETGKSRYIIEDDEFSRLGRIIDFARKTLALEDAVVLRFAVPMDPFGNQVDEEGVSRDVRGRPVDPASYLRDPSGAAAADEQRNAVYTRQVGRRLVEAYRRETVLLSPHLVCRVVFDRVAARAGTSDIYRLLRLSDTAFSLDVDEVERDIGELLERLQASTHLGRVDHRLVGASCSDVLSDALAALHSYHTHRVLFRAGKHIRIGSMRLLYYYQNRTSELARAPGGRR